VNKIIYVLLISTVVAALMLTGCAGYEFIRGTGNIVEKDFNFKDFQNIEISSNFSFDVKRSDAYSIKISARENIMERVEVEQTGNTLKIRLLPGSYSNTGLKADITLPEIKRLVVSGASRGTLKGFNSNEDFDTVVSGASSVDIDIQTGSASTEVSGASKITGSLKATSVRFEISGASRCDLTGSAEKAVINISGASQANLEDFVIQDADLDVSGASRTTVKVQRTLNVDVSGASSVEYLDNPDLGTVSVTGASRLVKR